MVAVIVLVIIKICNEIVIICLISGIRNNCQVSNSNGSALDIPVLPVMV